MRKAHKTFTLAATLFAVLCARESLAWENRDLVIFTATWCAPCKAFTQDILNAAQDPDYRQEFAFSKIYFIDLDSNPEVAKAWGVTQVPTIFYMRGNVRVNSMTGYSQKPWPDPERSKAWTTFLIWYRSTIRDR